MLKPASRAPFSAHGIMPYKMGSVFFPSEAPAVTSKQFLQLQGATEKMNAKGHEISSFTLADGNSRRRYYLQNVFSSNRLLLISLVRFGEQVNTSNDRANGA